MICKNCGFEYSDEFAFCPKCGASSADNAGTEKTEELVSRILKTISRSLLSG